jgi:hypothetical protein
MYCFDPIFCSDQFGAFLKSFSTNIIIFFIIACFDIPSHLNSALFSWSTLGLVNYFCWGPLLRELETRRLLLLLLLG